MQRHTDLTGDNEEKKLRIQASVPQICSAELDWSQHYGLPERADGSLDLDRFFRPPSADGEGPSGLDDDGGGGDEGKFDPNEITPNDLDLVMSQAKVPWAAAVAALKKSKGDVVDAIMELTM